MKVNDTLATLKSDTRAADSNHSNSKGQQPDRFLADLRKLESAAHQETVRTSLAGLAKLQKFLDSGK